MSWREEAAAAQDKPPFFLLKDQALVEIAKLTPDSPQQLLEQASRVVHENFVRFNGREIVSLLNRSPTEAELEHVEVWHQILFSQRPVACIPRQTSELIFLSLYLPSAPLPLPRNLAIGVVEES